MKKSVDYENMSVFEQIQAGLKEGISQVRGEITLKSTTLPLPAPKLSKSRVSAIRKRTGMSQAVFASYLNVPVKTLQSWEQGLRTPKASEARLLQMLDIAPAEFVNMLGRAVPSEKRSAGGKKRSRIAA